MFVLIKTELLKLKRSYMFLMCIVGSICAPLLNWLVFLCGSQDEGIIPDFYEFMIQTNSLIAIIIGTLLYGLFTTYIFEREFTEDMYKHLFTVPISKFNLLLSKIIVVMIGLLILTLTSFAFGIVFSSLSGFKAINFTNIFDSLILYLKAYLTFIPLMIPVIFVTFLFRGFVAPIAFSIVIEIILFIAIQSKYIALFPWSAPLLVGSHYTDLISDVMVGSVQNNLLSVGVVGIIAFIACMIYLNRKEIV